MNVRHPHRLQLARRTSAWTIALLLSAGAAHATDGYFSHGYGVKASGMGGAATATASDAMGGANNPASMAFVGDRLDAGVTLFGPRRGAQRDGSAGSFGPQDPGRNFDQASVRNSFVIPEFGYNRVITPKLAAGVTVYGNGGLNTVYPGNAINSLVSGFCDGNGNGRPDAGDAGYFNALCGKGKLGVNLLQVIVAPTLAYKLNDRLAVGVAPLLGYQRFDASGLQAFEGISQAPRAVTNRGTEASTGFGVRFGVMARVSDQLSLGAAYASKMSMSRFRNYAGLFAGNGSFDIPANYSVGAAWQPDARFNLAMDVQRIEYGDVAAVGNSSSNRAPLGSAGGPGFGWRNITVYKLGGEYHFDHGLTLRVGFNHSENPIRGRDVTFNILAPGVVQNHVTLGATYALNVHSEVSLAYMHAFGHQVTGASPLFGGQETIHMSQNSLGIAYGVHL